MRGPGGRRLTAAVLVALTLVVVGCSDDKKNDGSASGTDDSSLSSEVTVSTTAPTSSTTLSVDDQVVAAYEAGWDAVGRALDPPNENLPELLATHTGTALRLVQSQIRDIQGLGAVMRGPVELHPKLVSRTDTEATIEDCSIDHGHVVNPSTGERLDTSEPDSVTLHTRTKMIFEDGKWKRESSETLRDSCTPS